MIEVLPQSDEQAVGFRIGGTLTDDDYETVLVPELERRMSGAARARVLLVFDHTFDGWTASAMWDDAKIGMSHLRDFEKMAVVGGPSWVGTMVKLLGPMMKADTKLFDADQFDAAWSWLRA
jgi:hypothetical protein